MRFESRSEAETKKIAERLAKTLKRGRTVCLFGELGSGKTVFVKGMARALGIPERDVTSASFTIAAEHEAPVPLYHIDLYRLEDGREAEAAGVFEFIGSDGITVIEWAERLGQVEDSVRVYINVSSNGLREIIIEGNREEDRDNM